jgi:hypothetical protein
LHHKTAARRARRVVLGVCLCAMELVLPACGGSHATTEQGWTRQQLAQEAAAWRTTGMTLTAAMAVARCVAAHITFQDESNILSQKVAAAKNRCLNAVNPSYTYDPTCATSFAQFVQQQLGPPPVDVPVDIHRYGGLVKTSSYGCAVTLVYAARPTASFIGVSANGQWVWSQTSQSHGNPPPPNGVLHSDGAVTAGTASPAVSPAAGATTSGAPPSSGIGRAIYDPQTISRFEVYTIDAIGPRVVLRERPTEFGLSGDSSRRMKNITWTSWGGTTATGSGLLGVDNCSPDCAGGTFTWTPTTITLSNRGVCFGYQSYRDYSTNGDKPSDLDFGSAPPYCPSQPIKGFTPPG